MWIPLALATLASLQRHASPSRRDNQRWPRCRFEDVRRLTSCAADIAQHGVDDPGARSRLRLHIANAVTTYTDAQPEWFAPSIFDLRMVFVNARLPPLSGDVWERIDANAYRHLVGREARRGLGRGRAAPGGRAPGGRALGLGRGLGRGRAGVQLGGANAAPSVAAVGSAADAAGEDEVARLQRELQAALGKNKLLREANRRLRARLAKHRKNRKNTKKK